MKLNIQFSLQKASWTILQEYCYSFTYIFYHSQGLTAVQQLECHLLHLFLLSLLSKPDGVLHPCRLQEQQCKCYWIWVAFGLIVVRVIFFFFHFLLLTVLWRGAVLFHEEGCRVCRLFLIAHKIICFPRRHAVTRSHTLSSAVFIAALFLHMYRENAASLRGILNYAFPLP